MLSTTEELILLAVQSPPDAPRTANDVISHVARYRVLSSGKGVYGVLLQLEAKGCVRAEKRPVVRGPEVRRLKAYEVTPEGVQALKQAETMRANMRRRP